MSSGPWLCKSASTIAKMLCAEGYTDGLAQAIRSFNRRRLITQRQWAQFKRLKRELKDIAADWSEGDKLVIGKFIAYEKRMAFEAGLRVGLGAFAALNAGTVDLTSLTTDPPRDGVEEEIC